MRLLYKYAIYMFSILMGAHAFGQGIHDDFDVPLQDKQSFFVERAGISMWVSVNYDYEYVVNHKTSFAGRVGIGYCPKGYALPFGLTLVHGQRKGLLEVGGGLTYLQGELGNYPPLVKFLSIGFRVQTDKGLLAKAAFTPLIMDKADLGRSFIPYAGASVGHTIGR